MSGIDEQDIDVMSCGCKGFRFWIINDRVLTLGYLNPDAWMDSDLIRSVNKAAHVKSLSKNEYVTKIVNFHCRDCGRIVKRGNSVFERLCSDVRRRWDVESRFPSDGDE